MVREFEQRLVDRFRPEGAEDEMSYGEFLQRQAKRLAEYIAARRGEYLPMRLHA